jgi:long-chain acyl-CoA synthetase
MSKSKAAEESWTSPYSAKPWLDHYDYWVPPHINYPRRPLYEILRLTAVKMPENVATAFQGAHLTYVQIKEQTDKLATALVRLGVKQGDRVGIMLPNCPQYIITTFAILRLGAIVVNINPLYTPREVAVVARDSGMRLLITLDLLALVVFAARDQTSLEKVIIT